MGTPTIQLNVRVTPELRAELAEQVKQDRVSVNDFVTSAIRAQLDAAKEGKRK